MSATFLTGGGEMAERISARDWAGTGLGQPADWPKPLQNALHAMLTAQHPMQIFWGPQLIYFYNDAFRPYVGTKRHQSALGQPGGQHWADIWSIVEPQFRHVLDGHGGIWQENALMPISRGGREEATYWTYSCNPIEDLSAPSGVGGVQVTCTDTTKEVTAIKRLASENTDFARLFEQAPTFMAMLRGPNHRIELANPGYMRLIGNRDVLGKTVAEALPDAAEQGYVDLLDSVYRSGEAFSANGSKYAVQTEPGGPVIERFVDFVFQPLRDGAAEVVGIFVQGVDVTDRAVADVALRESEAQLRMLNADLERKVIQRTQARGLTWQVSPDLMGALNSKGYFETSNPAWQAVLGWSEAEVASMSIFELLHPDDVERTRVGFNLTQIGQPAIRFPNRYRCKDGSYRWISWVGVPEEGMVYCTGRDITEEKAAEVELARAQDALRQAQKMEAVGQLTGGIAHDFNNLLASISGSQQVLKLKIQSGTFDGLQRYLDMGEEAVRRAASLTQRLLAFSRRQTLDPTPTDINRLVRGMAELIRRSVGPNVQVEVVEAGGLWATRLDASQLKNSLLNLCINARDAMQPTGGKLTIETANKWLDDRSAKERDLPPGQYVSLCVTDTGTGMPAEVVERIFDPFYTTKPIGQGSGLGLSMVYGFVRQSGGQVRVYSEVGHGTTMCLYLPRHVGQAGDELAVLPAAALEHGDGETIVVVEDEWAIREVIAEMLREVGYRVVVAETGPMGLKAMEGLARVDLLLTDVGLPGGMNGRQVADAARVARPHLKVLFITGYADNAAVGNGLLEPGMTVITKPFEVAALVNKVRQIIDG